MNPTKAGWRTSEFWLAVAAHAAIAVLAYVSLHLSSLGVPPMVSAIAAPLMALALAWLNKEYGDNRVEIKKAAIAAGAAAAPPGPLNR